jgi:hypothetical protein
MKSQKYLVTFAVCLLVAVLYNNSWAVESLSMSVYAQSTQNVTGNITNNTTTDQSPGGNIPPLRDMIIEHAGGDFTSLQTDADNKTWITTGSWDLASDPSKANQSNSSSLQFNATIDMKGTDNSAGHKHEVSEFKLTNSSIGSSNEGSLLTFNGTGSIETDVGLYSEVPVSIQIIDEAPAIVSIDTQSNEITPQWIPGGGTIMLTIDKRVEDHFGDTPVYGNVRGED